MIQLSGTTNQSLFCYKFKSVGVLSSNNDFTSKLSVKANVEVDEKLSDAVPQALTRLCLNYYLSLLLNCCILHNV